MTIIMKNCAFVHIPKTGGTWIRVVLENAQLSIISINVVPPEQTTEGQSNTQHNVPYNRIGEKPYFCFVRNPITWYRSYWSHKANGRVWSHSNHFDASVHSDDFGEFIDTALRDHKGYLEYVFDFYTKHAEIVGLFETLNLDLMYALQKFDENWEAINWAEYPINVSFDEFKTKALYTKRQLRAIILSEKAVFDKYGYPTNTDYYSDYLLPHM